MTQAGPETGAQAPLDILGAMVVVPQLLLRQFWGHPGLSGAFLGIASGGNVWFWKARARRFHEKSSPRKALPI